MATSLHLIFDLGDLCLGGHPRRVHDVRAFTNALPLAGDGSCESLKSCRTEGAAAAQENPHTLVQVMGFSAQQKRGHAHGPILCPCTSREISVTQLRGDNHDPTVCAITPRIYRLCKLSGIRAREAAQSIRVPQHEKLSMAPVPPIVVQHCAELRAAKLLSRPGGY